nr:hypothetical protein [Tanacetum cinerariifolium]
MSSDNASSVVTYTSISFDLDGPSWGIPLKDASELPEMDPYEEHPEYHVPSDDDMQVEDLPYANDASPTAESPGYIADSESMEEDSINYPDESEDDDQDPEEDPEEDHTNYHADRGDGDDKPSDDDDDDDDTNDEDEEPTNEEEEDEHLAPTDSFAVPVIDPVTSAGDTEAFETDESAPTPRSPYTRVPFSQTRIRRAWKTIRLEPPMTAFMKACIAEHAAALIDAFTAGSPPFPPTPTSPAYDQAPLDHRTAMIRMRDDILEEDMPPQRRFVLTAPPPGCDVAQSSATTARPPKEDVGYVRALHYFEHRITTSIDEVNLRVSYQAQIESRDSVLGALKFSYICFRRLLYVFFVASLPPNLALVTGLGILKVEVPSAFAVV